MERKVVMSTNPCEATLLPQSSEAVSSCSSFDDVPEARPLTPHPTQTPKRQKSKMTIFAARLWTSLRQPKVTRCQSRRESNGEYEIENIVVATRSGNYTQGVDVIAEEVETVLGTEPDEVTNIKACTKSQGKFMHFGARSSYFGGIFKEEKFREEQDNVIKVLMNKPIIYQIPVLEVQPSRVISADANVDSLLQHEHQASK